MKTFIDSFGTIIKTIRKERQMTQKMLSQDICSQSVLSRIENNEELPNVVVMAQICQRLGVTIDQVMSLSNKDIRGSLKQFDLLAYYFRKRDYRKLEQLLKEPEIIDNLFWNQIISVIITIWALANSNYMKIFLMQSVI